MSNFFTKKELLRLGCTDDEIKLVMQYQKKLPILIENENADEFCINAKDLHKQLAVKKKFSDWFKTRVKSYRFIENIDYITTSLKREIANNGYRYVDEYIITIAMAENLAMVERTDIGEVVRNYFRLMRDIVRYNQAWWTSRNVERANYKPLCEALSNSIHRQCGRYGDKYDFAREANILNIISTGSSAQEIRNYLNVQSNELTRDSLEKDYNEKLSFLQDQDILLLGMNMSIVDRVKFIINAFDVKYPTASPLLSYLSREDMMFARNRLLNTLENK